MATFERSQKSTLLARLNEKPERLIVVSGPRQSGKTTLVRQVLDHIDRPHRYLAVDEPDSEALPPISALDVDAVLVASQSTMHGTGARDARWLAREWERARIEAERSEHGFVLVFDEIQKVANWSEAVKGLWDADRRHDRRLHVVLLGSAPLLLQRGVTESLAGRFETVRLTHWSFAEMSEAFGVDLPSYVYFGGYPGAASLVHDQDRWREYIAGSVIEPNIERDVLAMQRVDKPALLKRLFELGAEYSGQILAYNKMLGQLQDAGNTTTLARYLDLLSHGGLIAGLANHANHAHRRRALQSRSSTYSTPRSCRPVRDTRSRRRRLIAVSGDGWSRARSAHTCTTPERPALRLRYWRNEGREVDFILERGRRLVAFEVKSGTRRPALSGLREFESRFDVEESVLVGEGGMPLSEFLTMPAPEWFERT